MPSVSRRQLLLAGAASLAGFARSASASAGELVSYRSPRDYEVTHTVTVTNGNVKLAWLELWLPVPVDYPEQKITGATLAPEVPLYEDVHKQALVARHRLTTDLPGNGESRSISATYRVRVQDVRADRHALSKYPYRAYTDDADYRWYTRAEQKVEAEDAEILRIGKPLAGDRRSAPHVARLAYDLVRERTEYQLIDNVGGARYCLDKRHGECGDYSALLVALCRAAGVPARVVTGFWANKTDGWHCWAEFRLPTGEWIPLDVTLGDQNPFYRERYFGGIDNERVALCKTCDIKLPGIATGKSEVDFLQLGAWWWWTDKLVEGQRHPQVKFSVVGRPV